MTVPHLKPAVPLTLPLIRYFHSFTAIHIHNNTIQIEANELIFNVLNCRHCMTLCGAMGDSVSSISWDKTRTD